MGVIHLLNDVAYRHTDKSLQMVVEIEAGSSHKWVIDPAVGQIKREWREGRPRRLSFLPYPFNYGFVPQTWLSLEMGGDGDPLDVILLSERQPQGAILQVKVLGALDLMDGPDRDVKLITVLPEGDFCASNTLDELRKNHPGVMDIVTLWYRHVKGEGAYEFRGELSVEDTAVLVEEAHQAWCDVAHRRCHTP